MINFFIGLAFGALLGFATAAMLVVGKYGD